MDKKEALNLNHTHYQKRYKDVDWIDFFWFDHKYCRKSFAHFLKKTHQSPKKITNQQIFEHGFGDGRYLRSFHPSNALHGTEISHKAIALLKEKTGHYQKNEYKLIENNTVPVPIPFANESFDITICSNVLEHVVDDIFALQELRRITKPLGRMFITIPINETAGQNPLHIRTYKTADFIEFLKKNNYQIEAYEEFDYFGGGYTSVQRKSKGYLYGKLVRFGSIFFNTTLNLIPFSGIKQIEKVLKRMGIPPHQLILLIKPQTKSTTPSEKH